MDVETYLPLGFSYFRFRFPYFRFPPVPRPTPPACVVFRTPKSRYEVDWFDVWYRWKALEQTGVIMKSACANTRFCESYDHIRAVASKRELDALDTALRGFLPAI